MASRAYRRNNKGQFAGANGGTKVTYGKAGGFANANFRARVQASRGNSAPPKSTGSKAPRSNKKSLGKRIGQVARKNPALVAGVVGYTAVGVASAASLTASAYATGGRSIGERATQNRANRAFYNGMSAGRGLPAGMNPIRASRKGVYKVTGLR